MKRTLALLLALVMCLSLCACGKSEAVKAVESLIEGIGSISVSSSEKIKEAEDAYSALSVEEQKQVKNYEDLEKAREDFDNLGIHLTVDNYDKYLNVSFNPQLFDATDYARMMGLDKDIGTYVYSGIETSVNVSGKTDNYDYNDVVVTVKYSGFYVPLSADIIKQQNKGEITYEEYFYNNMSDIDVSLTATTDIVGNGSASNLISIPDGYWVWNDTVSLSYEVVDVSGILTK
ncbi:MAG: hypothetical protein E7472_01045 [Ruminococcaceae bacterium]|nr:hypothetical protein [Oscillospiraceae bacterium]